MKQTLLSFITVLLTLPLYSQLDTLYAQNLKINFDSESRITEFEKDDLPVTAVVIKTAEGKECCDIVWVVKNGLAEQQINFYSNGQIERILDMSEGVSNGAFRMYYPDGRKYVEQYYDHGKAVKTWYRWNEQGEIVEKIEH
jgi:antitoxin component YwqK of YwqJK toxin-antitoxin module